MAYLRKAFITETKTIRPTSYWNIHYLTVIVGNRVSHWLNQGGSTSEGKKVGFPTSKFLAHFFHNIAVGRSVNSFVKDGNTKISTQIRGEINSQVSTNPKGFTFVDVRGHRVGLFKLIFWPEVSQKELMVSRMVSQFLSALAKIMMSSEEKKMRNFRPTSRSFNTIPLMDVDLLKNHVG